MSSSISKRITSAVTSSLGSANTINGISCQPSSLVIGKRWPQLQIHSGVVLKSIQNREQRNDLASEKLTIQNISSLCNHFNTKKIPEPEKDTTMYDDNGYLNVKMEQRNLVATGIEVKNITFPTGSNLASVFEKYIVRKRVHHPQQ